MIYIIVNVSTLEEVVFDIFCFFFLPNDWVWKVDTPQ